MSYAKVLDRLIDNSGMTAKEVSDRCKEKGQNVTASYISILRNESKKRKASPELSKVLEEVLGAESGILAVEAYLENAPAAIIEALKILRFASICAIPGFNTMTKEQRDEVIEQFTLSDIVVEAAKQNKNDIEDVATQTQQTPVMEITDDTMKPTLIIGDRVSIKGKRDFSNGDIVCAISGDEAIFRKLIVDSTGKQFLIANSDDVQICEINSSMKIIGVVSSYTRKI